MDLFSLFRSSPGKQIERFRKKVREPHGDPATRMNAALRLREMGTAESFLALLDRFTINVSPSNQDEKEKEEILSWIIQMGEEAIDPLLRFLKRERQIYWAVKALRESVSEQKFAEKMIEVLMDHWKSPPASSDPTTQLIRLLEGVRTPELVSTTQLFLEVFECPTPAAHQFWSRSGESCQKCWSGSTYYGHVLVKICSFPVSFGPIESIGGYPTGPTPTKQNHKMCSDFVDFREFRWTIEWSVWSVSGRWGTPIDSIGPKDTGLSGN